MTPHAPIRIGVVGASKIARRSMVPALRQLSQAFEVVAVASRDTEKGAAFALEFGCEAVTGYQALIERPDIEALYVPLPTGLHPEWVACAIAHGKHVYVEKTFAPSLLHTEALLAEAQRAGVAVMEGYMFLYHRQQAVAQAWLQEGAVGEVRHVHASFGFPPLPADDFRYDEVVGGGVLMDAAGYPLRACRMLLGEDMQVTAASVHRRPDGGSVWGSAYLAGADGLGASVAFGFDNHYQCRYEVWGSRGKLVADRAFTAGAAFAPRLTLETAKGVEERMVEPDNHFMGAMMEFHRIVRDPTQRAAHARQILLQSQGLQRIADMSRQH